MEKQWSDYKYTVRVTYADGRVLDVYGSDDWTDAHKDYCGWFDILETGEIVEWICQDDDKQSSLGIFTYEDALLMGL